MSPEKDLVLRKELLVAAMLVGVGLVISAISLTELRAERPQLAQATQPSPSPPAESKPGGTRPTTPAPEPARPEKDGAKPVLPQAPAEKMAPPIKEK